VSAHLRNAAELLEPALLETIAALELKPEHAAAVKLAQTYARLIDDSHEDSPKVYAWAVRWVGPLLLDVLESLGGTPLARSRMKEGAPAGGPNKLEAFRQAHSRGA
jgi:hypothetical protein